jgi:hypothetical protein
MISDAPALAGGAARPLRASLRWTLAPGQRRLTRSARASRSRWRRFGTGGSEQLIQQLDHLPSLVVGETIVDRLAGASGLDQGFLAPLASCWDSVGCPRSKSCLSSRAERSPSVKMAQDAERSPSAKMAQDQESMRIGEGFQKVARAARWQPWSRVSHWRPRIGVAENWS